MERQTVESRFLGISFAEKNSSEKTLELMEWYFIRIDSIRIRTSKEKVLKQVLLGLIMIHENLGVNDQLSKIDDLPSEGGSECIYDTLRKGLMKRYHSGNEFLESV